MKQLQSQTWPWVQDGVRDHARSLRLPNRGRPVPRPNPDARQRAPSIELRDPSIRTPARPNASAACAPRVSGVCRAYRRVTSVELCPRYRETSSRGMPLLTRRIAVAWRIRWLPK